MSKASSFKEWFKGRIGHSNKLQMAYDAIEELEVQLEVQSEELVNLAKGMNEALEMERCRSMQCG